jgi:uncharacterized membrane protein
MSKTVTGVFNTRGEAETAIAKLEQAGFNRDEVMLLVSEETRGKHFGLIESNKSEEGATAGAAVGGLVGALYMALASAGTLFVPGLNLVVSGALIGSLAGLGAGAVTGGLVGALVGMGIPEHEAKVYEDKLRGGAILLAVDASDERADQVEEILKGANAQSVTSLAA